MTGWMREMRTLVGLVALSTAGTLAFAPLTPISVGHVRGSVMDVASQLQSSNNDENNGMMEKTFGGYTVKQRLREEVESPFRTVRLYFFGASTASALVAFYFSLLTAGKAFAGGFVDAPPLDEALQSVAINVAALLICGGLTVRDYKAGQANLARIKQGGALASLVVEQQGASSSQRRQTLADYRRKARVLIAAGGREYIETLCRSLCSDQLADKNTLPQAIAYADLIVVPVLLERASLDSTLVGDTATCWMETTATSGEVDRNMDVSRAESVVAFPRGPSAWSEVLQLEVNTAVGQQGFDVLQKGITLILKKNGKILRRATGQPQWAGMLGTMDVFDKNFGMPGDDQVYGSSKGVKRQSGDSL